MKRFIKSLFRSRGYRVPENPAPTQEEIQAQLAEFHQREADMWKDHSLKVESLHRKRCLLIAHAIRQDKGLDVRKGALND